MKKIAIIALIHIAFGLQINATQITIYNDGFATVKENRVLALEKGVQEVRVTGMSRSLEPDSVMLRERGDATFGLGILEQSYVNDPLTERLMLHQFEGDEVRFEETREDGSIKEHRGRVIRSGYVPGRGATEEPIVEVDGGVRFALPGRPVFEGIDAGAFLEPSLVWQMHSAKKGDCEVEVAYITTGMGWEATYSLIAPQEGSDTYDLSGWITLRNETGITYDQAELKLIAGDVQKVRPVQRRDYAVRAMAAYADYEQVMPEQRAFDEFHLYTLPRPVLLRNNEMKQVEFIRAEGVKGNRYYVYNPMIGYRGGRGVNQDPDYGATASKKVGVRIEIENSEENQLGVPLPGGIMRMYRTDEQDGRREFTGEQQLDHLPKNEWIKLAMGHAFDLVGERTRTDFRIDTTAKRLTESFEISLRNRKDTTVEIRVVEPMYRGANWRMKGSSLPYEAVDANTVEFRVKVPADGESLLAYTVEYSW